MSDPWIPGQSPTYYPEGAVIQHPSGQWYQRIGGQWQMVPPPQQEQPQ